jgi:hypothetical protein
MFVIVYNKNDGKREEKKRKEKNKDETLNFIPIA